MSELPKGWAFTTIGDVCLKPEQRTPDDKESFKYIDISCIDRVQKRICEPETISGHDAPSRARKIVNTGDVLVSMTRPNLNAVALVPCELDKQIASTGFDVLKPLIVEPKWLFAVVRSKKFIDTISGETIGALYPACKADDIRNYEIPLPPQAEQTRIVEKLDEVLAQVDTIKARLDGIPAILKRFRQSVLAAAVSGRLTEEWRGAKSVVWQQLKLDELVLFSGNGISKRRGEKGTDIIVLRLADFINAHRHYGNERTIVLTDKEIEQYTLLNEDILIIRVNGSADLAGKFILYAKGDKNETFCDHFIRLTIDQSRILPKYLVYVANEGDGRFFLRNSLSTSAGQNTINQKSIKALDIHLPSIEEQKEIVRLVDQYFAFADTIEAQVKKAQARVNNLTQSILAKAFRGELVPQDPSDEPAEKLLERIEQARIEADALAKAAKKAAKIK